MEERNTHFGYRSVSPNEKTRLVQDVFASVAERYDLMNDLMSFGAHRLWKRFAIARCNLRPGMRVLDLASGTGDMAQLARRYIGNGQIVAADPSAQMLEQGRDNAMDTGMTQATHVRCVGETLPFSDNAFDCVIMSFGLRNATSKENIISDVYRVLKAGGRFVILEFSKPKPYLEKLYESYSFKIIPLLGQFITSDKDSYRYLVESIRRHPDQETLLTMLADSGFERCEYFNMSGGIVAVHRAYKLL